MMTLLDCGIEIVGGIGHRLILRVDGTILYRQLVSGDGVEIESSEMRSSYPQSGGYFPLFVLDRASDALWAKAQGGALDFVATRDRSCSIYGRIWPEPTAPASRPNFNLFALARILLSTSIPMRQGDSAASARRPGNISLRPSLASALGVSQPHISLLLRKLPSGAVRPVSEGWVVDDFDILWNWHCSVYPGPGGVHLSWRSRHHRETQARNVSKVTRIARSALRHDLANAPVLRAGFEAMPVPTRNSIHAFVTLEGEQPHADELGPVTFFSPVIVSSMTELGYTRCAAAEASVQIIQPADPTVYRTASAWRLESRTDPLLTAWSLRGTSQKMQVAALRDWARSHAREN